MAGLRRRRRRKRRTESFKSTSISSAHRNHTGERGRGGREFWGDSRNEAGMDDDGKGPCVTTRDIYRGLMDETAVRSGHVDLMIR